MTNATRQKGLRGEQRAATAFRRAGWTVRRLQGAGDFLAFKEGETPRHVEVKYQRRLQLPLWQDQVLRETPAGFAPTIVFPDRVGRLWQCGPLDL